MSVRSMNQMEAAAAGAGTPPALSVSGRTDGDGYEVTAGARSITITAEAGATLVTTANGPTSGDVTVTDSTTTTPDWTAPADEALTIQVVATKGGLTSEVTFTEQTAYGGGAASWSDIHTIDFTSDITDLTLTKGGGDTNLRNAADTETKAVVGYADRVATTVSSAVITAAAGKFLLTSNSGSAAVEAAYTYVKMTEADTGVDWDDGSKVYAIDVILSGMGLGSTNDAHFIGIGTDSAGINAGSWIGFRADYDGANYDQAGRRYFGSGENGAAQNSDAAEPVSYAVRLIIHRGVVSEVWWQEGTTRLTGFPTASASVFKSFLGNRALGIEASPETTLGATFYLINECLTRQANNSTLGVEAVYIQEYA